MRAVRSARPAVNVRLRQHRDMLQAHDRSVERLQRLSALALSTDSSRLAAAVGIRTDSRLAR